MKIAGVVGLMVATASGAPEWKPLPSIPDRLGFAGSYAGASGGVLLVAGGANFPDKLPWEGGTKTWYDNVFMLAPDATAWRQVGHLPASAGYGVSVALDDGLLLIGGGDAKRNFSAAWLATWNGRDLKFQAWPALPKPLAMAAGARAGRKIYVAGGLDRPDATAAQKGFFVLDLDHVQEGWKELEPWPGPERMLATAGASGADFFLFSGARLVADSAGKPTREWLRDAYRYTPGTGWRRIVDLPRVAVAAPSPAPFVDGRLLVIGGDDGAQASVAPTEHKGFPRDVLAYDPVAGRWTRAGEVPFSLVTTTLARWGDKIVIAGGEQRPGVRSTAVWAVEVK